MSLTVIDPHDGTGYEIAYENKAWTIRETGDGLIPPPLRGRGPWPTQEQAFRALREMCAHKEEDTFHPVSPGLRSAKG